MSIATPLVGEIFDSDFLRRLIRFDIDVQEAFSMSAASMMFLAGVSIRGALFTSSTLLLADFRNDGGTMCIQYFESIVLDSSEIIYANAFLYGIEGTDNLEGPFRYSEETHGYNTSWLVIDTFLLSGRAILSILSVIMFCPDFLKNFISRVETGKPAEIDEAWENERLLYDLILSYL